MQTELVTLLSKYSVDSIAVAIAVFLVLYLVKRRLNPPTKLNRLLPFCFAFAVYCVAASVGRITVEAIVSKSFTAGGLATVLYSFSGGLACDKESEIKRLVKTVLSALSGSATPDELADKILSDLASTDTDDDGLKTIRVSDLIRAHLPEGTDPEKIRFISAIFVRAFENLKAKSKAPRKQSKNRK